MIIRDFVTANERLMIVPRGIRKFASTMWEGIKDVVCSFLYWSAIVLMFCYINFYLALFFFSLSIYYIAVVMR